MMSSFGLYLHIPFCLHKCAYCDFNSFALTEIPEKRYIDALRGELDGYLSRPEWQGRTITSIYFGGGTPSLLSPAAFTRLLDHIFRSAPVDELAEITLEANPGTIAFDRLLGYREAGINRISFGAQSFSRKVLSFLGRIHAPHHIEEAVAYARAAGFQNISLDLIYGVPHQSLFDLKNDLREVIRLAPAHVSAYSLTLEKNTRLWKAFRQGRFELPRESEVVRQIQEISAQLAGAGLVRYEISNFARRGREARHNLAYWEGADYLGLGAGAHSYLGASEPETKCFGWRWANTPVLAEYMDRALGRGEAVAERETISAREAAIEFFMLGLRRLSGVNLKEFERRFGLPVDQAYPGVVALLLRGGFVRREGCYLALSSKGLLVADSVMESFAAPRIKGLRRRAPVAPPIPLATGSQLELSGISAAGGTWKP